MMFARAKKNIFKLLTTNNTKLLIFGVNPLVILSYLLVGALLTKMIYTQPWFYDVIHCTPINSEHNITIQQSNGALEAQVKSTKLKNIFEKRGVRTSSGRNEKRLLREVIYRT